MNSPDLAKVNTFDWDQGNISKSKDKHNVEAKECEEIFFNKPLLINRDKKHSKTEKRFQALGITDAKRQLFVALTVRKNKIRIISARDQNKKERLKFTKFKN